MSNANNAAVAKELAANHGLTEERVLNALDRGVTVSAIVVPPHFSRAHGGAAGSCAGPRGSSTAETHDPAGVCVPCRLPSRCPAS